jgi:hypothetical protein
MGVPKRGSPWFFGADTGQFLSMRAKHLSGTESTGDVRLDVAAH